MKQFIKTVVFFMSCFTCQISSIQFKPCEIKDADFDRCLKEAIQDALVQLKDGVPEQNIPSIDPMFVANVSIGAGTGVVHLVQHYYNLSFNGLSNYKLESAHMDFDQMVLTFTGKLSRITIKANYEMDGRLLVLPVKGKGTCTITSDDIIGKHRIQFKKAEKNGDLYYIPTSFDIRLTPSIIVFKYNNLFDGNKLLEDNINRVLNEEWRAAYKDVGRNYELAFARFCLRVAKKVFEQTPANTIFLE